MSGPLLVQQVNEVGPSPRHSRADSPERTFTNSGSLLVGKTQDLGKHERFPSVRAEAPNKVGHSYLFAGIADHRPQVRGERDMVATPAGATSELVETDVAGDREQPRPCQ
jgi:hypothetical protein